MAGEGSNEVKNAGNPPAGAAAAALRARALRRDTEHQPARQTAAPDFRISER